MILLVYYNFNNNYYRYKVVKKRYRSRYIGYVNQFDETLINVIELNHSTKPKGLFGVKVLYK